MTEKTYLKNEEGRILLPHPLTHRTAFLKPTGKKSRDLGVGDE